MKSNTSTSNSQELSSASLSSSAVLASHTLSRNSSSASTSLDIIGISVHDNAPPDSDLLKNSPLVSDIESDKAPSG